MSTILPLFETWGYETDYNEKVVIFGDIGVVLEFYWNQYHILVLRPKPFYVAWAGCCLKGWMLLQAVLQICRIILNANKGERRMRIRISSTLSTVVNFDFQHVVKCCAYQF